VARNDQLLASPSSRALAADLDLSRSLVVEAYEQLVAEGYLEARPGSATRVASRASAR
jgi:GntR family transcriptional regulator/MocR family aminotransferase